MNFGIDQKVFPAWTLVFLHAGSPPVEVYSNGSANVLTDSQINTTTTGNCSSLIPAVVGHPAFSNTVTITETTTPQNPYYMISQNGTVLYRPPYSDSNPPLPNVYELTYQMCINNTGATTFCNDAGRVTIFSYYGINKFSIEKNTLDSLIISPNPSSDGIFTLIMDDTIKKATIEVYNMLGQKVYNETVLDFNEHQLFLDNLPKGTYLLLLENGEEIISKKIIRQ